MQLFYIPDDILDKTIILNKEESSHIVKVLRMKENEEILLTNGNGNLFRCVITDANAHHCKAEIISQTQNYKKRDFYIHLAIAPTKNINRIEWLIEKATEIGIDEITPILTEHSERKVINKERLDKIIISAMKQSLKAYKPILNDMTPFDSVVKNIKQECRYLCCCAENEEKMQIKNDYRPQQSVILFIGPEGDFSNDEVSFAKSHNCKLITLGDERLRTETAALYAISNIHFLNQ